MRPPRARIPSVPPIPQCYRAAEIAKRLGVTPAVVYELMNSGRLVNHRVGGARVVTEHDLLAYCNSAGILPDD